MRTRALVTATFLGALLAAAPAAPIRAEGGPDGAAGGGSPAVEDAVPIRSGDGLLTPGQAAPDFTLSDAGGHPVRLSDLRGKPLVVYFYPMDDTPGCTKEACAFRDDAAHYDSLGVRVVGISTDSPASHRAFAAKHDLPFTLLADTTGAVIQLYGTGVQIEQGGTKRWIANRVTYLLDADGVIRHVWPRVNPIGHSEEILAAWKRLAPRQVKERG
jgi:peroxiredoxin Q/BCP